MVLSLIKTKLGLETMETVHFSVFTYVFFFLVTFLFAYNWRLWKDMNKKRDKKFQKGVYDIPGPTPLPFLGTRWLYSFFGGYRLDKVHEAYEDLFRKYGPIIKEEALWNFPIVNIKRREDIEKVLRSVGKYPLRPPTDVIVHYRNSRPDRYASLGLVNEQGEKWHHLRTNLTSALTSTKTVNEFSPEISKIADEWCHLIKEHSSKDGEITDIKPLAERLALEITCALILGRRMGFLLSKDLSDLSKRLSIAVQQHFIASRDTYYGFPFWKLMVTSSYMKLVKAQEEIYSIASELIKTADDSTADSAVFQSIVNAPIDEREKTTGIVDFIAAGIHTLSNSLIFLLYSIGANPEVQKKLKQDLSNGSSSYLKACILESFRLLPTAYALARILDQDLELSGYHLKAGTVVLCHTGLAGQDDRYFPNAKRFVPDRWLSQGQIVTGSNTFLVAPFGVGKRLCPGKRFSEQALAIVLENVMTNFVLESRKPLELTFEFLVSPKTPTSLYFREHCES